MKRESVRPLPRQHDHTFGQDGKRPGELRTLIVVGLTAATMAVEIAAGMVYGSMALLADGLHMASHAVALSISVLAYVYARRHARDQRFCFGTGKVNSLAGFTGAILLALFALVMVWESVERLISPVSIQFDQALIVAVLGLIVNGISVFVLGHEDEHDQQHLDHDHGRSHGHKDDHNLRAAYLHVLADALTSLLAIGALLSGKYLGLNWLDPVMGVVGAILVTRWSLGLLATTSRVLLDHQGPAGLREEIRKAIEAEPQTTVTDLHLWQIGPGIHSLALTVVAADPKPGEYYRQLLPRGHGLVHATIETVVESTIEAIGGNE
ncbi:MAG: CDF family Co(II)/Ni(II) efflux transporter DmeF [Planctomycetaceae bacterium]|mgnify:CR=1 FL=1|nr:CDF family Co(II)/Ni(II) efflux transporter DmeF [Planctomycetaceae bacterium]